MTTWHAICIKDYVHAEHGKVLERGTEYTIGKSETKGEVFVFTRFWFSISKDYFAGKVRFT